MPTDKERFYVALYARAGTCKMPGGEDKYHWSLLVGPKVEIEGSEGKRYHARERMAFVQGQAHSTWEFEERDTAMEATSMILVRILIGKIKDQRRLASILESVPIRGNQPGWNCVEWVKEALEALGKDGKPLGTSITDWQTIRDTAMRYVQHKEAEHRFDGLAQPGHFDMARVPTFDLIEMNTEIAQ
ncbi:hypothetical protein F4677DRAFT_461312 [Hypoxylon crocopeplum]|nr:hypothetical protein F4677DRAFT_461312 [Hypoxylon crocopeplum]